MHPIVIYALLVLFVATPIAPFMTAVPAAFLCRLFGALGLFSGYVTSWLLIAVGWRMAAGSVMPVLAFSIAAFAIWIHAHISCDQLSKSALGSMAAEFWGVITAGAITTLTAPSVQLV